MKQNVKISPQVCEILFHIFEVNEYQRPELEDTGIPIFDTQTADILYVMESDEPDCNCSECRDIPFEKRCQILAEIEKLNWLLAEGWEMPTIEVTEPPRYVEIPHIYHRDEHTWLDSFIASANDEAYTAWVEDGGIGDVVMEMDSDTREEFDGYKIERMRKRIIDWLKKIGGERGIIYEFDSAWLTY